MIKGSSVGLLSPKTSSIQWEIQTQIYRERSFLYMTLAGTPMLFLSLIAADVSTVSLARWVPLFLVLYYYRSDTFPH
jgi:hypothetical protein